LFISTHLLINQFNLISFFLIDYLDFFVFYFYTTMAGGIPVAAPQLAGGYLKGRALIFPLALVISLFFLWGFSYGLLDVLNKHFQTVLGISRLESTGLQVMYFGGVSD
jgi:hypothetical protein